MSKTFLKQCLRQLLLAWLIAVTAEYLRVRPDLTGAGELANLSASRIALLAGGVFCLLWLVVKWAWLQRIAFAVTFALLAAACLTVSFTLPFALACGLVLVILAVYARFGWDGSQPKPAPIRKERPVWLALTAAAALAFFGFVTAWTVGRVNSFSTPSYDFGIFSQMFHSMRTQGSPMTTLERDGALSHFAVHVSPSYYLLLPFYALFPTPATLQVLQAAILASSVIPLWLLGKHHGLPGPVRMLLCVLLLIFPAFSGGTSYDIHENCLLAPCLLWLFYSADKKLPWLAALSALVTLGVKEDAAVYVAVIGLYLLLRALLHRQGWDAIAGGLLLSCSLVWFFLVTGYLAQKGDGVMTYRYQNFMFDGSGSLLTVVKAVLLCPMKAVYECVDPQKLKFLAQTMLPLLGLPLLTRRYERYLLLIPYVLVNLMSDYTYQHDIFFQYTFGSTACLFYLIAVNLADLKWELPDLKPGALRLAVLAGAVIIAGSIFTTAVLPTGRTYIRYCRDYRGWYDSVRATLDTVPEDASVTATTFYTTYLSQRDILYDVGYCSREHLLSTDYVVLNMGADSSCKKYGGIQGLVQLLSSKGYTLHAQLGETISIYKSPNAP